MKNQNQMQMDDQSRFNRARHDGKPSRASEEDKRTQIWEEERRQTVLLEDFGPWRSGEGGCVLPVPTFGRCLRTFTSPRAPQERKKTRSPNIPSVPEESGVWRSSRFSWSDCVVVKAFVLQSHRGRGRDQAISISRSIPTYFRASAWLYLQRCSNAISDGSSSDNISDTLYDKNVLIKAKQETSKCLFLNRLWSWMKGRYKCFIY